MNPQTKPSAGAFRAAKAYLEWRGQGTPDYIEQAQLKLAEIIDRASGLAELLANWQCILCALDMQPESGVADVVAKINWLKSSAAKAAKTESGLAQLLDALQAAIAKATNPNADTKQVYPKGRYDTV